MTAYFVSPTGSDDNTGTAESPWQSIGHAMDASLQPGDEVVVRPGTYNEQVSITQSGSAGSDIVLRSETPGAALIRPPEWAWNALDIRANHVTVRGFDISGSGGGDGIEANDVHHIQILDNIVHGNGESGIQTNWAEFITIDGNTTYGNAWGGWFSGISLYQTRNITGDTETPGFRTIVSNNISYDNVTQNGAHTDGNGIIIDDFQSTQTAGHANYDYPTLVENNLVYQNGGKGIAVHWSDNVTVRNNTAWHNNLDQANEGTWRGELSNQDSNGTTWINNIAVADPSASADNTAIGFYGNNENVEWLNNLSFNGRDGDVSMRLDGGNAAPSVSAGNLLGVDPSFVDPPSNFRLAPNSPARDSGSASRGEATEDLDENPRSQGPIDMGAYEAPGDEANAGTSDSNPATRDNDLGPVSTGGALTILSETLLKNDATSDGSDMSVISVTGAVGGTVSLEDGVVTFRPATGHQGDAGFSYMVANGAGETAIASVALTVVPDTEAATLFNAAARPEVVSAEDPQAVELGLKFQADVDGTVTAIRFFRGPGNDGIHPVTLWSAKGDILARGQATGTTDGWQQVTLDRPVAFSVGDVGVASYYAQQGHYSVDKEYFTDGIDNGPISVNADAGVYAYGEASLFPDSIYKSSNYWIDVVFTPDELVTSAAETAAAAESFDRATPLAEMLRPDADSGSVQPDDPDVTGDEIVFTPVSDAKGEQEAFDPDILHGGRHAEEPVQDQHASLDVDPQIFAPPWWHDQGMPHSFEW
ncbi:DUF4082 domain-containing protein [Paracoccus liaowanqingii]|uniref:DUF4082 domain-containing protein n=1 Tax=Paracoccus liaowanqingii TaxID=2560053 RepID=UPI00159B86AA|nr:DUF4082 domain-containing protein [Paracoccus liaowanqingii]